MLNLVAAACLSVAFAFSPAVRADSNCKEVLKEVPFCASGTCSTEYDCVAATGLSLSVCKDCLSTLASGPIKSCAPFAAGFCRWPIP